MPKVFLRETNICTRVETQNKRIFTNNNIARALLKKPNLEMEAYNMDKVTQLEKAATHSIHHLRFSACNGYSLPQQTPPLLIPFCSKTGYV